MAIPDYQSLMLPLLRLLNDGQEHFVPDIAQRLSDQFGLTTEERDRLLPSGQTTYMRSRVGWARTYLLKAKLLVAPRKGYLRISELGRTVLRDRPEKIDVKYLYQFPEFVAFHKGGKPGPVDPKPGGDVPPEQTPEESLEAACQRLRADLEADILEQVKRASPAFFERLVVEVLVKMGYGGTLRDAGQAIGRSGDGGIDGIIKEDRLGLDAIYLQAKRWDGAVGRPEIQKFAGALQGQRAHKGVFMTTGTFSREAHEYAKTIESRIVLIDGTTLAKLMIDHDVGVSAVASYDVKRVDSDFFSEE